MTTPAPLPAEGRHRVLIVGGGFGGLYAARVLGSDDRVAVTLVDRRNHHLFAPLLYQVATGALAPGEIAQPLRSVLRRNGNTTVLLGEAKGLDAARRELRLDDGGTLGYDSLIVATGAHHSYFGHDEWAGIAPGLKSLDDATEIRRKILIAFEAAEREHDPERRAEWLTFVIVGGGPTGVELAGALGEIARDTLRRDFRSIDTADAKILLLEGMDRVLQAYPPDRSASACRQLERLGVTIRTSTRVVDVQERAVVAETADGQRERIPAGTILWAAGVIASSFTRVVADATNAPSDRSGRILVEPDLSVPGHPEIFIVGDAAHAPWKKDKAVPGVAQGAIQTGTYAARVVRMRLDGHRSVKSFHYRNRGDVAVIGRLAGVTDIPWLGPFGRQSGFAAWFLWLSIHIVYLIGFANRIVVTVRWAWSFLTHGRGSRLITGQPLVPEIEDPGPPPSAAATDAFDAASIRIGSRDGPTERTAETAGAADAAAGAVSRS
ncbi:MAG TPA: NAD(P)/FAD-dependent oxidoreductase [Candidatus Limnocylindrales bacterium]|nr:NAD(P)/FAD-dependent oxidoreductase [Candidatus Limnocylindrales bacterium]